MTSVDGSTTTCEARRRAWARRFLVCAAVAFSLGACGAGERTVTLTELSGETMGTWWTVKVIGPPGAFYPETVRSAVVEELDLVDRLMSTWRSDSELSRLNGWSDAEPFPVSVETAEVLEAALEIGRWSGGAFDVTIGPLVDAWGFGPLGDVVEVPTDVEIAALEAVVGLDRFTVASLSREVTKADPGVRVDLSAIAKGYAVDRVSDALIALGAEDHMVEVGGEIQARGVNLDGVAWRIAVERPIVDRRQLQGVVSLANRAMATSGDYRNYREVDGVRISHTIDARTGRPIAHRLAAVTVLDDRCMRADALATALMVLGRDGVAMAESEGIEAVFLFRADDGFEEVTTGGFAWWQE